MKEQTIKCPQCGQIIELNQALSSQISFEIEEKLRLEFNQRFKDEIGKREEKIKKEKDEEIHVLVKDLREQLNHKSDKLKDAQQKELDFLKRQRELEDREHAFKLEMERKLTEERSKIRSDVSMKLSEEHRMKDAEKEKQINDLRRQIEELNRKAELGSQQSQGEVMELELENVLRQTFRHDNIEPVPKGVKGADVMQHVYSKSGQLCGTILWESKRTKNWSDGWIQKLKDDQREVKASIAVIVSAVLPKDVSYIGNNEGIWITDFSTAMGLAAVLRTNIIEIAQTQNSMMGRNEKKDLLYNYLSSQVFRQRIEAIVESFKAMNDDLESEKRAMYKIWEKRKKQIDRVIQNTSEMHGELEGIMGNALPPVQMLELPLDDIDNNSDDEYTT
ncbi:DUF2130 domain-containing protein [bacterium]|nr:MAG: DUF2130 domain-containing protein [bacterium]